jgi:chromosome partitioning protein
VRTISIVNQKGGCGKTTTAVNVAAAFAQLGESVLLVDLDPQAHVTSGLGRNPDSFERTILDALMAGRGLDATMIVATNMPGVDLVPCNVLLANAELQLATTTGGGKRLMRCLSDVQDDYDLCVIDGPPSFGILTANALAASDEVIIPVSVPYHAMEGLKRLIETIRLAEGRGRSARAVRIHILLTFVEGRRRCHQQVQRELSDAFGGLVLSTVIHRNVRLAEAPGAGMSVLAYAPQSQGAADYRTLAREVLVGRYASEEPGIMPARRGVPKRLAAIFGGLWTSSGRSARRPSSLGSFETT